MKKSVHFLFNNCHLSFNSIMNKKLSTRIFTLLLFKFYFRVINVCIDLKIILYAPVRCCVYTPLNDVQIFKQNKEQSASDERIRKEIPISASRSTVLKGGISAVVVCWVVVCYNVTFNKLRESIIFFCVVRIFVLRWNYQRVNKEGIKCRRGEPGEVRKT